MKTSEQGFTTRPQLVSNQVKEGKMKKNLLCRMGLHNEKFVRELRVKERGFIKIYEVTKCERCGKLHMSLYDIIVDSITPRDEWNKNENYELNAAIK